MMTRAELAFGVLDRENTGFISFKQFRRISNKLSEKELQMVMKRVKDQKNIKNIKIYIQYIYTTDFLTFNIVARQGSRWQTEF